VIAACYFLYACAAVSILILLTAIGSQGSSGNVPMPAMFAIAVTSPVPMLLAASSDVVLSLRRADLLPAGVGIAGHRHADRGTPERHNSRARLIAAPEQVAARDAATSAGAGRRRAENLNSRALARRFPR
jgi:hypothetical protein